MIGTCPACGGSRSDQLCRRAGVPVNSCLLVSDQEAARGFPRGDLDVALCLECGFVWNREFDPGLTRYSADYEETQGFSPHFQRFIEDLARDWVSRYDLVGGRIVEIGCGKGEFLAEMLAAGVEHAVGVDPGLHPERLPEEVRRRLTPVVGFFPEDHPSLAGVDAVVCRHTLEHIAPVAEWLRSVRAAIPADESPVVLFELPDVVRVLEEGAFWDVYYEHCSYFSPGSLARLFRRCGFDVLDVRRAYDDQYLLLEARPTAVGASDRSFPIEEDVEELRRAATKYAATEAALVSGWRERLRTLHDRGGRAVVWGSGSKGVAFLSALGDVADVIECAVDINPHKHGRFMAGTGHRIVAPAELVGLRPDLVVAMNPVYTGEIRSDLESLGLAPDLDAV